MLRLKGLELLFLDIVVRSVDRENDGDRDENGKTFDPAFGPTFVDYAQHKGHCCSSDQNFENIVVKVVHENFPKRFYFSRNALI